MYVRSSLPRFYSKFFLRLFSCFVFILLAFLFLPLATFIIFSFLSVLSLDAQISMFISEIILSSSLLPFSSLSHLWMFIFLFFIFFCSEFLNSDLEWFFIRTNVCLRIFNLSERIKYRLLLLCELFQGEVGWGFYQLRYFDSCGSFVLIMHIISIHSEMSYLFLNQQQLFY